MAKLTHVDGAGNARMVDVGAKPVTRREARARARVCMEPNTLALIEKNAHAKGDVLAVARVAGIQGAKRCSDLIPLCHPLMLESVSIEFRFDADKSAVEIETRCRVSGQTGVEMEALTAAAVAALTIYDMCKAVDRGMSIEQIALLEKRGGKSGDWVRGED
ncbi:MAG: cyclic pyranopterin monophosphate synthase MoaC [Pseudomonadales bacterium]